MKELIEKIKSLPRGDVAIVVSADSLRGTGFRTEDLTTLADRLAAYEEMMSEAEQIEFETRELIERFGDDWQIWTNADGYRQPPFKHPLEAFAALKGETNNAG